MPLKRVYKYLIVSLGCMFISPLVTHAECSYERQAELSRIASNVGFSYNYEMVNSYPEFTVNINNITNDIYIEENILGQTIYGVGEKQLHYYNDNLSISFDIYSNDQSCRGEKLLTQYITLPKYNFFSTSDECKEYPSFQYCAMWLNTTINVDQFNDALKAYKHEHATKTETKEPSLQEKILKFFKENQTILIISVAALVLLVGILIYRRRKEF